MTGPMKRKKAPMNRMIEALSLDKQLVGRQISDLPHKAGLVQYASARRSTTDYDGGE